ncbi:5'-nucleotidase C-terminal domain-containing protein [Desulfobacterales bacterium HSG17]|nr:5'-nucleotidase C-terminal domain-containing protein [Desulfobacterales bacterium HSG17]
MKIYLIRIAFLFFLLSIIHPELSHSWDIIMLTTSDTKGQLHPLDLKISKDNELQIQKIGGFARLAWFVSRAKKKFPGKTLLVTSGDDLAGPYFKQFHGKPIFEAMNVIGYDVGTLGNQPFDYGDSFLNKGINFAEFPLVISNITVLPECPLYGKIPQYVIVEKNNLKIGVIGLMATDLAIISNPCPHVLALDNISSVCNKMVELLKRNLGTDLILVLAHIGPNQVEELVRQVPEIDIVIYGGRSSNITKLGREAIKHPSGKLTIAINSGAQGSHIGMLKLSIKNKSISDYKWQSVLMDSNIHEDADVKTLVESYNKLLPENYDLARSLVDINLLKATQRTSESGVGNLICDILRKRFKADIALYNGGSIRGNKIIAAGSITNHDVAIIHPYGNTVSLLALSGETIKQALELGVSYLPQTNGAFLQVSGMRYTIDIRNPAQELIFNKNKDPIGVGKPGSRVQNVAVLGNDGHYHPLNSKKTYTVVTSNWIANGGDAFFMFKNVTDRTDTDLLVKEVVEEGIQGKETISTKIEGRIKIVGR